MSKRHTPQQMNAMRKDYFMKVRSGMTKQDAASAAGFSPSMARNAAHSIETPEMRDEFESLQKAISAEIDAGLLAQKLREGLDATTVKTAQSKGQFTDEKEFPDYRTRLRYIEKIALMSGMYQPKAPPQPTTRDGGPIDLEALTDEQLKERELMLEQELGIVHDSKEGIASSYPEGEEKAG